MMRRIAAIGVLAGAVAVAGCGRTEGAEAQRSAADEEVLRTVNVEVIEVRPAPFTHFIRVVGTVEAQRDVMVSAEEGGVVEALVADRGERVRAGQTLIRIDDDVLAAQLEQAASQAALAEETWQRQKQLWEQDSIGTEIAYLQARYNAESAKAQAKVLNERVRRAVVRAPISGILDDRMVEVGSMVGAGTPVARILDADTVEIVGGVPERYAADIEEGAEVMVTVSALEGRLYAGSVDFVGSAVDGGSRTFQIEVDVPNPGLGIKPGMVANVQIARRTLEAALAVPRHAVIRREDGYIVFVARPVEGGWRAESRAVVPGVSREELVVIEEGLEPGDRVVVVGQQRLAEGDALRLAGPTEAGSIEPAPADAGSAEAEPGEEDEG
jgi:membrane fusion protein (multidrug efflux system)